MSVSQWAHKRLQGASKHKSKMIDLKRDERVQGHLLAPARFSSGQVEPICARMCNKLSTSNNFKSISVYLFVISGVLAANVSQSAGMTIRQAPSQLFLAHLNQETPTISRVAGLHPKRADEEADGFIMKAEPGSVNQPDQTTTIVNDDTTTTMIPESDRSIPIDTNRQQFVTHDQLNLLNATTRDEYINLTGGNQSIDFSPPNRDNRAQTSRTSGMSKVSHVSNIISGKLSHKIHLDNRVSGRQEYSFRHYCCRSCGKPVSCWLRQIHMHGS